MGTIQGEELHITFLDQKKGQSKQGIHRLKNVDGTFDTYSEDIFGELKIFYADLYTTSHVVVCPPFITIRT